MKASSSGFLPLKTIQYPFPSLPKYAADSLKDMSAAFLWKKVVGPRGSFYKEWRISSVCLQISSLFSLHMHWVSINIQTPDPLKDIYTIVLMRCTRIYSLYKSIICVKIYLSQGIIRVLVCRLTSDPQDGPHTTDRPRKPRTPHTLWADSARDVSDVFFMFTKPEN